MIRLLQASTLTISYLLWRLGLWLCLVGVLLIFAVGLLFAHLPNYHNQIEEAIMVAAGYPVKIGHMTTGWHNGMPSLALHDLKVQAMDSSDYVAEITHAEITFDFIRSLQQGRPIAHNILIHSQQLTLIQARDGQWQIKESPTATSHPESIPPPTAKTMHPAALGEMLHWLLRQPNVTLAVQQLHWRAYDQPPLQLQNLAIQLTYQANKHWLSTEVQLPAHWGTVFPHGHLRLTSWSEWDIETSIPSLQHWQGNYQLTDWQFPAIAETAPLASSLKLTGHFQTSRAAFNEFPDQTTIPAALTTATAASSPTTAWYVRIQQSLTNASAEGEAAPWLGQTLWMQLSTQGKLRTLQGKMTSVELSAWQPWLIGLVQTLAPSKQQLVTQLQPSGQLDNLRWHYAEQQWQVQVDAEQLAIQSVDKIPAVQGVSGQLQFGATQGQLTLASEQVVVHSTRYFSQAHAGQHVTGQLHWRKRADAWRLSTHDLQAQVEQARAQLTGYIDIFPSGRKPRGNFQVAVHNAQVTQVADYIPDRRLAKTVAWLDQALHAGTITEAELHFQGTLTDVFKNQQDGQFSLTGAATGGKLNYAPGWIPVEDINGQVTLHNKHLVFTADQATLVGSQVQHATVTIADLSDQSSAIEIVGRVTGSAAQGLTFLRESPILEEVDAINGGLAVVGNIAVDLELQLLLAEPDAHVIRGVVQFINTDVTDNVSKLQLTDVNGTLQFDGSQLNATDLQGKLFGLPTTLAIHTLTQHKTIEFTRLNFTGQANRQFIKQHLTHLNPLFAELPIYPYLTGQTTWQATLDIPNHAATLDLPPKPLILDIITDFAGMQIDLPAPFAKSRARTTQPLRISAQLFNDKSNTLFINYGQSVQAALHIANGQLAKGALHLAVPSPVQLPTTEQFKIKGRINRADLMTWLAILTALPVDDSATTALPMQVDLHLAQLNVFGSQFPQVQLAATYQNDWQFTVKSADVAGQIRLRQHHDTPSLFMDFAYLHIPYPTFEPLPTSAANLATAPVDPRQLPAIALHAASLQLGDLALGTAHLFTHINPSGLVIEQFNTHSKLLALQGKGHWYYTTDAGHRTRLDATLNSPDTGQLLQQLSTEKAAIRGGVLNIALDSQWAGPLYNLQPHQLEGKLSLSLQDGHIVDVEPGAVGRMFGLLAIQALPRRLSLDFSDVFAEGFGFESIAGDFTMQAGFMHTNDLLLRGPAAEIQIQGHTDFVEKIYNQQAIVTPHVTNTLPVAGALAGGVSGGALALVVQQILQPELEKAMQYKYQITGPWQEPQISLISQPVTPQPATEAIQEEDYDQ